MSLFKARAEAIELIGERRRQMDDRSFNFAVEFWAKRFIQRAEEKREVVT